MNLRKEECQMNAFRIMLGALVFLSFGVIEANAIDRSINQSVIRERKWYFIPVAHLDPAF